MVDTRDLKSLGHCARAGSSPASGTLKQFQSFVNERFTRDFSFICPTFTFDTFSFNYDTFKKKHACIINKSNWNIRGKPPREKSVTLHQKKLVKHK